VQVVFFKEILCQADPAFVPQRFAPADSTVRPPHAFLRVKKGTSSSDSIRGTNVLRRSLLKLIWIGRTAEPFGFMTSKGRGDYLSSTDIEAKGLNARCGLVQHGSCKIKGGGEVVFGFLKPPFFSLHQRKWRQNYHSLCEPFLFPKCGAV